MTVGELIDQLNKMLDRKEIVRSTKCFVEVAGSGFMDDLSVITKVNRDRAVEDGLLAYGIAFSYSE